ncbi:MAG: hypothetical protein LBL71_04420 [Endomicrobium sp.]|jgi:hypothetical protein|nr:hypothetical protein [Endomicrobium sp.]
MEGLEYHVLKEDEEKYDIVIYIHTRNLFEDFTKEDFEKYPDKFKFGDIRVKVLKEDMAYKPIEVVTEYLDKNKIKYEHKESGGIKMLRHRKQEFGYYFDSYLYDYSYLKDMNIGFIYPSMLISIKTNQLVFQQLYDEFHNFFHVHG